MSDLFEPDVLGSLLRQWSRGLRARNRSARTIETYTETAEQVAAFAREHGQGDLDRALIEDYLADLADRWKPSTVAFRYRSLQQFTKWLAAEGELDADPMLNMRAPHVPEEPVPVLTPDDLKALLGACKGRDFADRRDTAIIRLFVDTGMRLAEMTGLAVDDLDMDCEVAVVLGKGRRPRSCPFGAKTCQALDRYLRLRGRHRHGREAALWLGDCGPMTTSGIRQLLTRRGRDAGVKVHPHMFRRTFADQWKASGGDDTSLMRLAELLADFAVVICHDVPRVGVDPDQAVDGDLDSGLLASLAGGGMRGAFADVDGAAGDAHRSLSRLWIISSAPSLMTTAVTEGMRLLYGGAAESSK